MLKCVQFHMNKHKISTTIVQQKENRTEQRIEAEKITIHAKSVDVFSFDLIPFHW